MIILLKSLFARYVYNPLYILFYKRDSRSEYYKLFKKLQWQTIEKNLKYQAKKLYEVIDYASKNIPYYKKIVESNNINFSEKTIFEDIKKFPILDKKIMRNEFNNLHKKRKNTKWYYNTSGGSTGEPVKLIQDTHYSSNSNGMTRLQLEWTGYLFGDTLIKLWGSQTDVLQQEEHIKHRFANWIKSITILDSFSMDNNKMEQYIEIINKKKPKLILAYAQSVYELAKYIEKNNKEIYSPNSIMTSAGILYPQFRDVIQKIFGCPVFNRYGSREIGNVASECEKHEGLHLSSFTHYVEILNDKLKPCKEGELGELYITLLTNYTMPLIRYKIGDMAVYTKKNCSCSRGLPLINNIVGRDVDVFVTKSGKIVQGEFFIHFIGVVYNEGYISKFQVIQEDYDNITIKIVLINKLEFNKNKNKIVDAIKKLMGKSCDIKFVIVKDIKPSRSGKYRYTIRKNFIRKSR